MKSRLSSAIAAVAFATAPAYADRSDAMMYYQSCMAAADIIESRHPSVDQLDKAPMCFGAITAIMNLEPLLRPEFGMCPPKEAQISFGQIVLVVADYLKKHPDQLDKNFHLL